MYDTLRVVRSSMIGSEPTIQLRHHAVTKEGPCPPADHFGKWIPYASDRPAGLSPQAVRVFRRGEHPVTPRLLTTQTYKNGRGLRWQPLISDASGAPAAGPPDL